MFLRTALVSESSTHLSGFQTQHAHCVSEFPLVAFNHVVSSSLWALGVGTFLDDRSPPTPEPNPTSPEGGSIPFPPSSRVDRIRLVSRIRCVWDAFVLTVASLTTLAGEIDASHRIMSSYTEPSSTGTDTDRAGGFGCYGLFFGDPPPLDDLEPRPAPPLRNRYRDNASVPYWYHGIISRNANTPRPSTAVEATAVPSVRIPRDSMDRFEQSRDAYLRMLGDGWRGRSTLEAVEGEGDRSQIPPLFGGYPARMPGQRVSGAGVSTHCSPGIVAHHDFPGTLHLLRTPTAPVSQGLYPAKEESGTPNVASPSSSPSTEDRNSKESDRSQTPLCIPFPLHLPPWWNASGYGGFRGSSGPVPDYGFTGAPTSPPRSFASVEQESVQPTSPERSEPSVPERSDSPVQVFSTSADLAAYYGIPPILPPPPKPLQSASRETVQQKASGSPHTAFEAMRDSYLKMLNTINAPSVPTHEERGRELAALYGIEEQMDDNTQLEELIDYLASPQFADNPCFGDNLDMNQLLIDPEYHDFPADKDGYDHDHDHQEDEDDLCDNASETPVDSPLPGEECHVGLYLDVDCLNNPFFSEYLKEPVPTTDGVTEL
ncbi:hypothetical protein NMY22_g14550 [Coprinellus aureogranulatus]|nr:hypothetical protein NMY22_g14550 [Coprinellus aureogranulatus]